MSFTFVLCSCKDTTYYYIAVRIQREENLFDGLIRIHMVAKLTDVFNSAYTCIIRNSAYTYVEGFVHKL